MYSIICLYTAWKHWKVGIGKHFIGFLSKINVQTVLNLLNAKDPFNNVFLREFEVVFSRKSINKLFLGFVFIHLKIEVNLCKG